MRRIVTSGVRFRLFALVLGLALPLAFVGFFAIQKMWEANRRQLSESLQQQAELTAATYEQWVDAQREVLAVFSRYPDRRQEGELSAAAGSIVASRSHWVGLHIVGSDGEAHLSRPAVAPRLSKASAEILLNQLLDQPVAVETDWTREGERGLLIIAAPTAEGGAVVAQVDLSAMSAYLFPEYKLPEHAALTIVGPQHRILLHRDQSGDPRLGTDLSDSSVFALLGDRGSAVVELQSPIDGVSRVYGLARAGRTGALLMVGMPSHTLYEPARQQMERFLIFSVSAVLLALLGAVLIARGIAAPIRHLSRAARRFGRGDLTTRALLPSSGEIEDLRISFNAMASQIEEREMRLAELDELKSDFVSGVSHEMRTPLTTIKTLTRVLLRSEPESERRGHLETIAAECDRQIDLVLNLLDLSRIESGTFNVTLGRVDVAEVVQSCLVIERHGAEARRQFLLAELPEDLPAARADRVAFRRVLCCVVENAIKYTPRGGRITLSAGVQADQIHIRVEDTGCGICAEDLPFVFDKFYRGRHVPELAGTTAEASAYAAVPGVGLGLYLAKSVIEEIGGHISVASTPGVGTRFTISLPVWEESRDGREED